jgi:hypothetical protein
MVVNRGMDEKFYTSFNEEFAPPNVDFLSPYSLPLYHILRYKGLIYSKLKLT